MMRRYRALGSSVGVGLARAERWSLKPYRSHVSRRLRCYCFPLGRRHLVLTVYIRPLARYRIRWRTWFPWYTR